MAFSVPPVPDGQVGNLPTLLFGPGRHIQERYDDPEVQGGKIALIAFKQIHVQKPPNSLDSMQSTLLKQVAFNQRIIEAENEISGTNCDLADFVAGMTLDPAEEMIICVNGSEEMKRSETAMAGQLWMQGERKMAGSNPPYDGMSNSKEAAILTAVAEAVVWKNDALEVDGRRRGQWVVIYPKELTQLDAVLTSGDPNIDEEDGHPIAYQKVLAAAQSYENPPVFLREDCERITSVPVMAEAVPRWMCMAERIATGIRPRVLENGPDVWHYDDEAKEDVLPDVEKGMYTEGMDPEKGPTKLSQHEAARQRAAAPALKSLRGSSEADDPDSPDMVWSNSRQTWRKNTAKVLSDSEEGNSIVPSRQSSQTTPSPQDDDDWSWMTPDQRRKAEVAAKAMAGRAAKTPQPPRCLSAPGTKAPKKSVPAPAAEATGKPATRSRAVAGPVSSPQAPEPVKAVASQRAPAGQSKKGQESPGTKVPPPDPHPMATRRQRQASGAGSSRPGGGSGQTDTCVDLFNPSKTRVVISFLRGGFLPLAIQRRSMAQRDNRLF
jgi:hypothetical protein